VRNDAKTVNAISQGAFSKNTKVIVATLQFFLGTPEDDAEDSGDDEKLTVKDIKSQFKAGHSKKTKKREKKMQLALAKLKKKKKKTTQCNLAAIELIHDPQGFAEKLFRVLKATTEKFDVRLMMMNLISRLIGHHKLIILDFYPYLQKYMNAKQQNVTYVLAVL